MAETIALIDYGAGNLHSVESALVAAGAELGISSRDIQITSSPEAIRSADRIILPGVGAYRACADSMRSIPGMTDALEARVLGDGRPFLGICVGMQLLASEGHEDGRTAGLGWIEGAVERIAPEHGAEHGELAVRVPHMGWNAVCPSTPAAGSETFAMAPGEAYFLHSYQFHPADESDIAGLTDHGGPVVAAVARGNIVGVQFHPEKSQEYGLSLLRRFLSWHPN